MIGSGGSNIERLRNTVTLKLYLIINFSSDGTSAVEIPKKFIYFNICYLRVNSPVSIDY